MTKKVKIVATSKALTKEERRIFSKDNPGYKLSLELRYPNFPLAFSCVSLAISIIIIIAHIVS